MPSVRSIALGFWVRTGSRDEGDAQAGISHFLEHLLFKGTDRFSSRRDRRGLRRDGRRGERRHGQGDDVGLLALPGRAPRARLRRPPGHGAAAVVPGHRLGAPGGDRGDRHVRGRASDKVHDVLAGAIFGDHPLGRPIIGRADVVVLGAGAGHRASGTTRATSAPTSWWRPPATWTTTRSWSSWTGLSRAAPAGAVPAGPDRRTAGAGLSFHRKDTEQYHLCLGAPGHTAGRRPALRAARAGHDPRRLHLVAPLPGGAREARAGLLGLLLLEPVRGLGQVAVYVGTRPDNIAEALSVIGDELRRLLADGVTPRRWGGRART